ncbi:hypothetical protein ACUNV4_30135, partial [Granulosicoccus sp. 3-233]|uniref:hypothetical protein n=1 Tax=Granulosicoccus sp. 3-233 TaxID=3417969 RepID=UPI003D32EC43
SYSTRPGCYLKPEPASRSGYAVNGYRHEVYQQAKAANPERWSGDTRNWVRQPVITLNPDKREEAVS